MREISFKKANDGGSNPPRLEIQQAMWSMKLYGNEGVEWPLERKFEEIAKAGFTGIFGSLPEPKQEDQWLKLMEEYGFSFGLESFPTGVEDLKNVLEKAQDYNVLYVNAQVKDSFTIGPDAVSLLNDLYETADHYSMPFFVETHRGRITQDLLRTASYVREIPNLALTIDLSHYVLAGEMYNFEKAEPYFDELLHRTASIHARVTNAQQIQVDIGVNANHPMVAPFMGWWKKGMQYWLQQAKAGDVLPFVCEIGHHYAVTPTFVPGTSQDEISDRWAQSKLFKHLAVELWKQSKEETQ